MTTRNFELAQTLPDTGDRISEVRVTTGNHPVSSPLRRKAAAVEAFAADVASGLYVDRDAVLADKLRMLAATLESSAAEAERIEQLVMSTMGGGHG
jgi:hypothetical protein